jgi:cytochrome P450
MYGSPTDADAGVEELDPSTLFSPAVADDPVPFYKELHARCPVHRAGGNGNRNGAHGGNPVVHLSRYEDVRYAMRHPEIFSSAADAVHIGQERPLIPLQLDPPEHAKYRRLLDPELSPKWVATLEDDTRAKVDELLDGFVENGACEFHEEFSQPLPSSVFLELFGLPAERQDDFFRWRDNIIRPSVFDIEEARALREETSKAMYAFFEQIMDEQRDADHLFGRLLRAEVEGERLSREEILDISYLFLIAGLDTVTATLDCAITNLARNPERRRQLAERPELTADAVEELLRIESPVQVVFRVVTQPVTIGGVELEEGDHVSLVLGATNVDDEHFERAEETDFERDANRHLAFGGGPHRCLGSHLARMELRVALEQWHRRIPEYELADGAEVHFSPGIRQAPNLPLVWSA